MRGFLKVIFFFSLPLFLHAKNFSIPRDCRQLILGIAKDAHSPDVTIQRWVLTSLGWHTYETPWHGKIARDGLAWGIGIHPDMAEKYDIPRKIEGDWRSPAGVFEIGPAYGQEPKFPERILIHYYPLTDRDLWIEDCTSVYYNQHIRVHDGVELSDWQKKQRMKVDDPAHKFQLLIKHNYLPHIKPGCGSAIFFHIWRDNGKTPTSGCTAMSEKNLIKLISWLDPEKHPLFVLLPESVYKELKNSWKLP